MYIMFIEESMTLNSNIKQINSTETVCFEKYLSFNGHKRKYYTPKVRNSLGRDGVSVFL